MTRPKFSLGQRVRHVKTGRVYRIVDLPSRCRIEATGAPAYSYCLVGGADITLWVRPQSEMEDGRFEPAALGAIASSSSLPMSYRFTRVMISLGSAALIITIVAEMTRAILELLP